jgi:hypothetical protein
MVARMAGHLDHWTVEQKAYQMVQQMAVLMVGQWVGLMVQQRVDLLVAEMAVLSGQLMAELKVPHLAAPTACQKVV